MGSETKVGLLVGMCFIVCFAIILAHRGAPEDKPRQGDADKVAANEDPLNQDASRDAATRNRQATRRVDDMRQEPPMRPFRLQPRRYANSPSNDAPNDVATTDRFRRRSAPLPAPRSTPAQTFEEGFADALANTVQSTDHGAPEISANRRNAAEPGTRSTVDFLQAAQPLLDAGRQMADRLADAGYELSRQAQLAQANRRAEADRLAAARGEADAARAARSRAALTERRARESLTTEPRRPQRAPESRGVYLVKSGDNLTRVARQVYQDDSKHVIDAIYDANRGHMNSPDHLVVGREIVLPKLDGRRRARNADERIAERTSTSRHAETPRDASDPETLESARQLREDLAKFRDVGREPHSGHEPTDRVIESTPSKKYVVKSGDTLIRIVRANYGTDDPETVQRVFAENQDRLAGPDAIMVGQTLLLPEIETQRAARTFAVAGPVADRSREDARQPDRRENDPARTLEENGSWRWYQLQKGDLYSTVAQEQLGTAKRWRELAELNADIFPDPSRIRYGVRIRIPVDRDAPIVALNRRGARR